MSYLFFFLWFIYSKCVKCHFLGFIFVADHQVECLSWGNCDVAWHPAHKLFRWRLSTVETLIERLHETWDISGRCTASFSILSNAHSCSFHAETGSSSSSSYYYCQLSYINKITTKQTQKCVLSGSKEDSWESLVLRHRNVSCYAEKHHNSIHALNLEIKLPEFKSFNDLLDGMRATNNVLYSFVHQLQTAQNESCDLEIAFSSSDENWLKYFIRAQYKVLCQLMLSWQVDNITQAASHEVGWEKPIVQSWTSVYKE